jgi:4-amino-4-deoxy-L-arabinose transferase-like glycosyltransferase
MITPSHRRILELLLIAFVVLAVAYSLANPLYEATDEVRHVRYVRHLAVYKALPEQVTEGPRAQSHHPPLYYALAAVVSGWVPVQEDVYYRPPTNPFWAYRYWEEGQDNKNQYLHGSAEAFPFRGITLAVYLMRWFSVLLGLGVVYLTYRLGRAIWPGRPALALAGAALVAFNPQFLYLSGAVGNDVAAALAAMAVLLASVHLASAGYSVSRAAGMGVLFGLALLTKFNLVVLLAIMELALLFTAIRSRDWRPVVHGNLVLLPIAALISGWWFLRNQLLYGEPTGFQRVTELWGVRDPSSSWGLAWSELPYFWSSLWGRFGYGQVPLPDWIYQVLALAAAVGLAGALWQVAVMVARRRVRIPVLLLLLIVLLIFVVVFAYILVSPAGSMGRFFFPGLPALALLIAWGWARLLPRRWEAWALALPSAGVGLLALWALVAILRPAFAPPSVAAAADARGLPNETHLSLGGLAELRGYDVAPSLVRPGEPLDVTVYWETLSATPDEYTVFVHLIDGEGVVVAQRDTYPGLGRYPTTAWAPGNVFADTYRIWLPDSAYAPNTLSVKVGLYRSEAGRLLTPDGRDALELGTVVLEPRPDGRFPNPTRINLNNDAALVGYELGPRAVRPGETIELTLYWEPLRPITENYSTFVQALSPPANVVGKADGWAGGGLSPTRTWHPGEAVIDKYVLPIAADAPPGIYDIVVGMIGSQGNLPVVADDGHWLDDRIWLSRIRVAAPDS